MTEEIFEVLLMRYKELRDDNEKIDGGRLPGEIPYDLDGYLVEMDTGKINADYMNSRFEKYLKALAQENVSPEELEDTLNELHKSFAGLSQEEQKYANVFLHDVQRGDVELEAGKTFREYVYEYIHNAKNDQIHRMAQIFGLCEDILRNMMSLELTEANLNEFGRFEELRKTVDKAKAKEYFEKREGTTLIPPKVNVKIDNLLKDFILLGGFDLE